MDSASSTEHRPSRGRMIKCVVWDLDETIWEGVLVEGGAARLRAAVLEVIQTLDSRGILQSIASRNYEKDALGRLAEFGLADYFVCPQINWGSKADSIRAVAAALNLGIDAFAFVDNEPFELSSVAHELPAVLCVDAADLATLPDLPGFMPRFVTEESRQRRVMVQQDARRAAEEERSGGASEAFLAGLGMVFAVTRATEADLQRAEELTIRTNQLNSTGIPYSYDELHAAHTDPSRSLWIARLDDRFGSYGTIGLVLFDRAPGVWTIRLLLMSCRVMSRGVGSILLNRVMSAARESGVRLQADFIHNDRNRMMFVTYKFAGFREVAPPDAGGRCTLECDLSNIPLPPPYVVVQTDT